MKTSDHSPTVSLTDRRILIVEDEPFIAFDLAAAIEDDGGFVVGPAGSVKEALELITMQPHVEAAILDVNLPDGDIGPVIAELTLRDTPMLVHTGAGLTPELSQLYPKLRVFNKPTPPPLLARAIAMSIDQGQKHQKT